MSGNKRYLAVLIMILISSVLVACAGTLNTKLDRDGNPIDDPTSFTMPTTSETTVVTESSEPTETAVTSETTVAETSATTEATSTPSPAPSETSTPTPSPTPTTYQNPYDGEYGSAGTLDGRTVVVSVYMDDVNYSWSTAPANEKNELRDQLGVACTWLSQQAADYGATSEFIYDWSQYPELYFTGSTDLSVVNMTNDNTEAITDFIFDNVDSEALLAEFEADDIIYIFFFNTPKGNEERSNANSYAAGYRRPTGNFEYVRLYTNIRQSYTEPAVLAHEILHLFGAPDMYSANDEITQAYVDHLTNINSNEVMFSTWGSYEIMCDFTDLDAYYVGLIDDCEELHTWNLGVADRFK